MQGESELKAERDIEETRAQSLVTEDLKLSLVLSEEDLVRVQKQRTFALESCQSLE
jgi:hypothetical protein